MVTQARTQMTSRRDQLFGDRRDSALFGDSRSYSSLEECGAARWQTVLHRRRLYANHRQTKHLTLAISPCLHLGACDPISSQLTRPSWDNETRVTRIQRACLLQQFCPTRRHQFGWSFRLFRLKCFRTRSGGHQPVSRRFRLRQGAQTNDPSISCIRRRSGKQR